VELHRHPFAVIGGAIEHAGTGALNWAVYFSDFGRYQKPFDAASVEYVSDINVSYKRAALMSCAELWRSYFHETSLHGRIRAKGETLWLTPKLMVWHDRGRLRLWTLLAERVYWGRVFAGRRAESAPARRRGMYLALSPGLPVLLLAWRAKSRRRGGPVNFVVSCR
jgi:hypothetical protein